MTFDNDELSMLFLMTVPYVDGLKAKLSETPKTNRNFNRLIAQKNSAVALKEKLSAYLKMQGISIYDEE